MHRPASDPGEATLIVSTESDERRAELAKIARRAAELDAAGAPLFSDEQIARAAVLLPVPPNHVLAAAGIRRAGDPPPVTSG